MTHSTVTCPGCSAELKMAKARDRGKAVQCPKCGKRFRYGASRADVADQTTVQEPSSGDGGRMASRNRSRPKKQSNAPLLFALIGGAAVFFVVAVVAAALVFVVLRPFGGTSPIAKNSQTIDNKTEFGGLEKPKLTDPAEIPKTFGELVSVIRLAYSPNGKWTAAFGRSKRNNVLCVFDAQTGKRTMHLQDASSEVTKLAYSPDGQRLACLSWKQGSLLVWQMSAGEPIQKITLPAKKFSGRQYLWFASDNKSVLTTVDRRLYRFDVNTGAADVLFPQLQIQQQLDALTYSPAKNQLLFAHSPGDKIQVELSILDLVKTQIVPVKTMPGRVRSLAFSPGGNFVAFSNFKVNGPVEIWNPTRWAQIKRCFHPDKSFIGCDPIVLAADGKHVAGIATLISGRKELVFWDVIENRLLHRESADSVEDLVLGPDERTLTVLYKSGRPHYAELETGKRVKKQQ